MPQLWGHFYPGDWSCPARFSREAESYVERLRQRVVLIDGEQLADLMIEHGVGVTTARSYLIKRIDEDYFNTTDL